MTIDSAPSPGGARGRRATEKRRAILRAAAEAFRRTGFAQTGMRDIAEAADVSAANLYYYFKSKHDLLYFCQDHSLDRLLAVCRDADTADATPADALRTVIRGHLACILDELDGASAHLEIDELPPAQRKPLVAKRDRYEKAIRKVIARGVESGSFRPLDPPVITRAILGALNWTARWYRPGGPKSPDALALAYADYLVHGLEP